MSVTRIGVVSYKQVSCRSQKRI